MMKNLKAIAVIVIVIIVIAIIAYIITLSGYSTLYAVAMSITYVIVFSFVTAIIIHDYKENKQKNN